MLVLDHIAVAATSLPEGVAATEAALCVELQAGGQHPDFGTYNRLLGLGPEYLEVIAIDPSAPPIGRPRWFHLDAFAGPPRLTNWIVRVASMEAALQALGPEYGAPVSLRRGDLRWRMAVPASGLLPFDNCAPAVIEWETEPPLAALTDHGYRLEGLTVSHPRAAVLAEKLGPYIDDPRLHFVRGLPGLRAEVAAGDETFFLS